MKKAIKFFTAFLAVAVCFVYTAIAYLNYNLSNNYQVIGGEELNIAAKMPVSAVNIDAKTTDTPLNNSVGSRYNVKLNLFGIIPVKTANIQVIDKMYVAPLGIPFGMKIYTDGVLVINISPVDTAGGYVSPAEKCGIKVGDTIISINNKKVYTNEDVAEIIETCESSEISVTVRRDNVLKTLILHPEISVSTGTKKAGIWVRDSSAGIGTLTFYYPVNNTLCGLGHAVCDTDTGKILEVDSGDIAGAEIVSYTKATHGTPGELNGRITSYKYGDLLRNCECGVYGTVNAEFIGYDLVQVALKQEIQNGTAYVISTVNGSQPKMYTCEVKVNGYKNAENKDLTIKITDEELLSTTGGILQGMSGSPLIQNGKLIGAVTHVLVDDPTKGYGIFAENMLETAQTVVQGLAPADKLKEAS